MNTATIPFNKPYFTGKETEYITEAMSIGKICGDGFFTKKCHEFFETKYGLKKCLLTTSCTDALEMSAILIDIKEGDEVIMPSYTFVSTANAFALRGAKIVFADSNSRHPNIDASKIESLITSKTKALVIVHYAGIACDMDAIMTLVKKYNLYLIEDAAHAIDSYYNNKPLGSFGHFATFSFHETKNIISGEGGMLVINDERFIKRAEIIREKGTNRSEFLKGEINKYEWVDIGSSFLPSEIIAAFLYSQLEQLDFIQRKRLEIWNYYHNELVSLQNSNHVKLPALNPLATNNAHVFYLVCNNLEERDALTAYLKSKGISAVFHYTSLHNTAYFKNKYSGSTLIHSDIFSSCLLRLPLYVELTFPQVKIITEVIKSFFSY